MLSAADVMTKGAITASPDMTVENACRLMLASQVSGLVVVDENKSLVGMITEGDFLRRVEIGTAPSSSWWRKFAFPNATAESYVRAYGRKVGEVMTRSVVSVSPDCGLDDVVTLMEEHHIKRLPVVSKDQLVGIVSRSDLLKALVHKAALPVAQKHLSDAEIRCRLMAEIEKQLRSLTWGVDLAVEDGFVHLRGIISDPRERCALRVIAENTSGVKGIRDELVCVEPLSGVVIDSPQEVGET